MSPKAQQPAGDAVNNGFVGRLTFRTWLGGGDRTGEYCAALRAIEKRLKDVVFPYEFSLMLYIGEDMITISDPTEVINIRVSLPKRLVIGTIRISSNDAKSADEELALLASTIYRFAVVIFGKVAAKDRSFDTEAELSKLDFLRTMHGNDQARTV